MIIKRMQSRSPMTVVGLHQNNKLLPSKLHHLQDGDQLSSSFSKRNEGLTKSTTRQDEHGVEKENSVSTECRRRDCIIKKVSFNVKANELHDSPLPLDSRMHKELWYSLSEMKQFKREANEYIKDIQSVEKGKTDTFAFAQVFLNVYDACCKRCPTGDVQVVSDHLSDSQRHCLVMWMGMGDRWGLEKRIVKDIHWDITWRKGELRKIVLSTQHMMSSQYVSVDVRADYMAKACQILSRPSRMFAQLAGEAQEQSLQVRS